VVPDQGGRKGRRFHAKALGDDAAVAERVLERIRADGPLSSADFERESGATSDWFGMPENAVRSVLEALTVSGRIGLQRRHGNTRYYGLLERLLPAELLAVEVPEREQLRHKLLSRYRAHGLLGAGGAGGTFARIADPPVRRELLKELLELGALVPLAVEGLRGKRFVLADEVAELEAPPAPAPAVALVAPYDSPLWDTALLASLFGFEFVCEGFFPPAKRRWGPVRAPDPVRRPGSSGGSSRGSTAPPAPSRSSASGGRTASSRAARRASSTRFARRSTPTSSSPARAASWGCLSRS
jgi:uncharacterized protein YcaQ